MNKKISTKNLKNMVVQAVKMERACNDLPCTIIDNLLPNYDLPTITKQIITYNDGSFDYTGYLRNRIQPFGCKRPLIKKSFNTLYNLSSTLKD